MFSYSLLPFLILKSFNKIGFEETKNTDISLTKQKKKYLKPKSALFLVMETYEQD